MNANRLNNGRNKLEEEDKEKDHEVKRAVTPEKEDGIITMNSENKTRFTKQQLFLYLKALYAGLNQQRNETGVKSTM